MIVIVTGSRHGTNREGVYAQLDAHYRFYCGTYAEGLTVRHGDCRDSDGNPAGIDSFAHDWCQLHSDVIEDAMPADWDRFGKAAGPIRNKAMCAKGADEVLAFPIPGPRSLSRGTWGCVDAARRYGIPVRVFDGVVG